MSWNIDQTTLRVCMYVREPRATRSASAVYSHARAVDTPRNPRDTRILPGSKALHIFPSTPILGRAVHYMMSCINVLTVQKALLMRDGSRHQWSTYQSRTHDGNTIIRRNMTSTSMYIDFFPLACTACDPVQRYYCREANKNIGDVS